MDSGKKKIWRGFVDYVNAADLQSNSVVMNDLAQTLFECMPWMIPAASEDDVPAMIALRTNREPLSLKSLEQLGNQFRQQAVEYQPRVRQLLTWLSDRKQNAKDRPHAFAFLREHTKHIEFADGDPAYAPEDEQFRYFTPGGDLKDDFPYRTFSYKDLADVICDFVHKEHEAGRGVPIRICKRPGCGKLVTQFKKRQYCRTSLCERERQKREDDLQQKKNRDNVFLFRLRKMTPAMRKRKVRESIDRLRQIESDWRDRNLSLVKHALKLLAEAR